MGSNPACCALWTRSGSAADRREDRRAHSPGASRPSRTQCTAVAARNRTGQDLELLDAQVELLRASQNVRGPEYAAHSGRFHLLIAEATHNDVLATIVPALLDDLGNVSDGAGDDATIMSSMASWAIAAKSLGSTPTSRSVVGRSSDAIADTWDVPLRAGKAASA